MITQSFGRLVRSFSSFRPFFMLVAALALLTTATPGFSHSPSLPTSSRNKAAEELTQALTALATRQHLANPSEQPQLLGELLDAAAKRHHLFATLFENNPAEALRLALPDAVRAGMPSEANNYLEERLETEGELQVQHVDYKDPTQSHYVYLLKTDFGERFSLHFAKQPPELLNGARVRANGLLLRGVKARDASETEGAMALGDEGTGVQFLAAGGSAATTTSSTTTAPLPNTFGEQKTVVILVNFQDKPTEQPWTKDQARSTVFTTVSNFFKENSYDQTWLAGDVYGWYTIALNSTACSTSEIGNAAEQAATAAGVNLSIYTRIIYAFPSNACGFDGMGTVGGTPSKTWINGKLTLKVVSHELGHNFGLNHAHALDCGYSTLGSACKSIEYGDTYDTLGNPTAGHYTAFEKERLGWLGLNTSPLLTSIDIDGTYTVGAYEPTGTNPRALKILKGTDPATGQKTWYYVEYRQAIGFDSFLSNRSFMSGRGDVTNGVVVHIGTESDGNSGYLLHMNPVPDPLLGTVDWFNPALAVGDTFSDPEAGVTISPLWADGNSIAVDVHVGAQTCAHANPTVTFLPSQSASVSAGTAVTYTVSVTNHDSAGCAASGFTLQTAVPSSWTAAFAAPTLTVNPGASASTTLTVTSPTSTTGGSYTVGVTATNSASPTYAASTSATYNIASSFNVTISTDQSTYTRSQTVSISAKVSSGGSPVANANVIFNVTKSNGAVVTGTATTGTNGSAVYKLRLKRLDPAGVYQARAEAANNTLSGNAAMSFAVQ